MAATTERLIRLEEVIRKTGQPRSTVYRDVRAGTFPKPVQTGKRSIAWVESEIDQWIHDIVRRSRDDASTTDQAAE